LEAQRAKVRTILALLWFVTHWCTSINTFAAICLIGAVTACQERSSGAVGGSWGYSQPEPNSALQALVEGNALAAVAADANTPAAERARLVDQVRRVYKDQHYQLIWINGDRPNDRYRQFAKALDAADDRGLPRALYALPIDAASRSDMKVSAEQAPQLDAKVTATFLRYFSHMVGGRLDPRTLHPLWKLQPERPDLAAALSTALTKNDLTGAMARLQPQQPEYRELEKALVRYRAIAAKGGWPPVPLKAGLKPNQQSPALPALRQRLAIEGDLDAAHEKDPSVVYDATLVEGVKRFQERHRIKPDGIIDPATVAALNVPVEQRIRTIALNLERWRWLPDPMPARYLIVNVPDFRLEAIENGKMVMDMRVVVGEPDNKTPIFADEMTHVIFSPYWNIPPGIAKDETIPRAMNDPAFLARNNMEVVNQSGQVIDPSSVDWSNTGGMRIRQRPGSGNALGGVKFVFPNNFDVYLHDTNATKLFDRVERGLSHGCVRVEEPLKLAQYVLRDQSEWTPESIDAAMKAGQEKHVKLSTSIPVYIVYKTAWVHDGGVRFLKDLYGHDADQSAKLFGSPEGAASGRLETRR
jgi:murein L,D-transpeptidase YcbB/YkuD